MSSAQPVRLTAEERRRQLLEVARSEFLVKGFAGARVQSVAERAGVNNALIYKHFDSKEALFEAAIMAPVHELLEHRIEALRTMPRDLDVAAQRETMREFLTALLRMMIESCDALGVILFSDRDRARHFYTEHLRPVIDTAVQTTLANLSRWEHRDFDVEIAWQTLFGTAFWLALDRSMRGDQPDLGRQVNGLIDLVFDGINP